jgi:hypothetical protein
LLLTLFTAESQKCIQRLLQYLKKLLLTAFLSVFAEVRSNTKLHAPPPASAIGLLAMKAAFCAILSISSRLTLQLPQVKFSDCLAATVPGKQFVCPWNSQNVTLTRHFDADADVNNDK